MRESPQLHKKYGTVKRRFVLFTTDLQSPLNIVNLFDVWDTQLMIVAPARVWRQIKELCPQAFKIIQFRLLRNIDCDVLYHDICEFEPDYVLTYSYFFKLPERLFQIAKRLAFNFHPSLLPLYKGAAPYTVPLENNDKFLGLSIHELTSGFDEGRILHQIKQPLDPNATEYSIMLGLKPLLLKVLTEFLSKLDRDQVDFSQNAIDAVKANRRRNKEFWFNPQDSCEVIERTVRARNLGRGLLLNRVIETPKGPGFQQIIVNEVLLRNKPHPDHLRLSTGTVVVNNDQLLIRMSDGILELSVVTHQQYGLMSAKRYIQIEKLTDGQHFIGQYPGENHKYQAIADKRAEWYYRDMDEKFSPHYW